MPFYQQGGSLDPSKPLKISNDVLVTGALKSNGSSGVGYETGAGGKVTQITSKSTAVTLNKLCGTITTHAANIAAAGEVGFTVNNSLVAATDVIAVSIASGATADTYHIGVDAVAAGSFRLTLTNVSGGGAAEALVINFIVLKGVAA